MGRTSKLAVGAAAFLFILALSISMPASVSAQEAGGATAWQTTGMPGTSYPASLRVGAPPLGSSLIPTEVTVEGRAAMPLLNWTSGFGNDIQAIWAGYYNLTSGRGR